MRKKYSGTLLVACPQYANGTYTQIAAYKGKEIKSVEVIAIDCNWSQMIKIKISDLIKHFRFEAKFSPEEGQKADYLATLEQKIAEGKSKPAPKKLVSLTKRNFPWVTEEKCLYLPEENSEE